MEGISLKELLPILFERSTAVQTFWNYDLTVILALAAFLATARDACRRPAVAVMLTIAFAAFADVNLGSIVWVTRERAVLADAVTAALPRGHQLAALVTQGLLAPPSVNGVVALHLAGDLVAVVAIWVIPRFSGRGERSG